MPDYEKMYTTLFNAMTSAIHTLQEAQQTTEEIYVSSKETRISLLSEVKNQTDIERQNKST